MAAASPTLTNESTSAASSLPCQRTVPLATASASHRSNTVSRVERPLLAMNAQFREVMSQGRSGPGAIPGQPPIRTIVCSELSVHRSSTRSVSTNRCLATLAGKSSIAVPPATAHCDSATSPEPSSAFSALPPVISTQSTSRQTGRSTGNENSGQTLLYGCGAVVSDRNAIRSPEESAEAGASNWH